MAAYSFIVYVNGVQKALSSAGATVDFSSVRIGASTLAISEASGDLNVAASARFTSVKVGASLLEIKETTGHFDFSAKKLTNIADGVAASDAASKGQVDAVANDVGNLVSLSGVAVDSVNLGTFTGSTIPDSQTVKQAIQSLETSLETVSGGSAQVKISSDDTTAGYLEDKIVSANSILSIATLNNAANEDLQLTINQGNIDHGSIAGLSDDDHSQYHNDTRGDARYYQKSEFVTTSTAGAPVKLDGGGKIALAQLPSAIMTYEGVWNASTNSPSLADGTGDVGMVYRVGTAGSQFTPSISFDVGDYAIYNGTKWEKSDTTDAVASVNSQTGIVTVNAINQLTGDITAGPASGSESKVATIAAGAVTETKIGALAVTEGKIGAAAVTEAKIADDAVTAAKIAAGAVGSSELATDAVIAAKIAADAVTTAKILDANVTAAKLAADSVTTAKILDANVTEAKLAADAVSTAKIANLAVTTAKIADLNVTAAKLAADSVTTAKILDANVTGAKIASAAVDENKLAASVAGAGLSGGAGSALAVNVDASSIEIATDTLQVKDLGISTAKLADGSVTAGKLGALSVTAAKLGSDVAGSGLTGGNGAAIDLNVDGATLEIVSDQAREKVSLDFTNDNAGAITIRQVVYLKADGDVDLARADVASLSDRALGLVFAASISAAADGAIRVKSGGIVSGFSGLTTGAKYFVDASTAGAITATAPSASGQAVYQVGEAVSATELRFDPRHIIDIL